MADAVTQHEAAGAAERIVIEPQRGWSPVNWRELWRHRELLYFLAWRDIKVRYKQTVLGAVWAVLQPLVKMVVFTVIFKRMAHMDSEGYPYPVFLFAGMLPWQFFSGALRRSSDSIVNNSNVIGKVYFPRLLIPTSAVVGTLVDHALSFLVLGGIMIYYGITPTVQMLAVVPLALLTGLAALGVGAALSSLTVAYRDLQFATPFLVDTWFFLTPIVWSFSKAGRWQWLVSLNPMCGIVEAYRAVLLPGHGFNAHIFLTSLAVTAVILTFGLYFFRRLERGFADVV